MERRVASALENTQKTTITTLRVAIDSFFVVFVFLLAHMMK